MKFWVDMDNAPHVHVLRPLIVELERRGHSVEITARDHGQTLPLLRRYGLQARVVGRHGGKNMARKLVAFATRTLSLLAFGAGRRFDAAFSHGSRSLVPAAHLLGIPVISMGDYEYATFPRFMRSWINALLVPDVMSLDTVADRGIPRECIHRYPGLKEELYIHDFQPDPSFLGEMKLDRDRILVLVRPPATMAHYAVRKSATVFSETLEYLCGRKEVQIILLPRTELQRGELAAVVRARNYENVAIPQVVYHGPNLVWHADLVISGGGTMNREAAALDVPVYSIYQGPIGAVDRHLIENGKLVHVGTIDDLRRIPLRKRDHPSMVRASDTGRKALDFIVERILETAGRKRGMPSV